MSHFDQSLKKELYTLVGLAIAVSTLVVPVSISIYKQDLLVEKAEDADKRLSEVEIHMHSRGLIDKRQDDRIKTLENALFIPRNEISRTHSF